MPISVVVRNERGRTLARLEDVYTSLPIAPVGVTAELLPVGRREMYPMLGYIDPVGNTCFNRAQANAALAELRQWDEEQQTDASNALLAGLTVLLAGHMSRPHCYLWFIGD